VSTGNVQAHTKAGTGVSEDSGECNGQGSDQLFRQCFRNELYTATQPHGSGWPCSDVVLLVPPKPYVETLVSDSWVYSGQEVEG
jgi:hypothetical protein